MRKPEQRLWDRMRDQLFCQELWLQRIENVVVAGMPDVMVMNRKGTIHMVELKWGAVPARAATPLLGNDKGLNVDQRNWLYNCSRKTGKCWVLIGTDKRDVILLSSVYADRINGMPVQELKSTATAIGWNQIKTILERK